jgi:hypothetical protein
MRGPRVSTRAFGFLWLSQPFRERKTGRQLVATVEDVRVDLGSGFAFLGSQAHLRVAEEDDVPDTSACSSAAPAIRCRSSTPSATSPKPIGVAEWETQIVEKLPEELKGSLPTAEEIEAELGVRGM